MFFLRWRLVGLVLTVASLLVSCGDKEPIRLGYLGGTSGRVADLGISGRNGAQLAIELANQRGGIDGRQIELIVRDDEQNPELAKQRFKELVSAGVSAVIGPMTSSMAVAILPLANEQKMLVVSPTATANELGGKDDQFFRVIDSTNSYASAAAQYQFGQLGQRKVALVFDQRNKAYSESWAGDFRNGFEKLGGKVILYRPFESGDDAGLGALAEETLRAQPDAVVMVANSVDAALLAQHLRRRSPGIRLATSEWAATERFIELAGSAAEGVVLAQFFDRSSTTPGFVAFREKYQERFGEAPGFGSVTAFDAANVLIESLSRHPRLSAKEAVMAIRRFSGLQTPFELDAAGDARRHVFVTVVRDGRFVVVRSQ